MKKCKLCKNILAKNVHGNQKFCSPVCSKIYYENYRKNWKDNHPKIENDYTKSGQRAYNNIRQRCENRRNPQFSSYGGRGISLELTREEFTKIYFSSNDCELCGRTLNDENRSAANGRTLDRIDQARPYEDGNLRILCRACNTSLSFKRRKYKV